MRVDLIGFGMDNPRTLTLEGRDALDEAELILGAPRLLGLLPPDCGAPRRPAATPSEVCTALQEAQDKGLGRAAVLFSGDIGFYSGAAPLRRLLPEVRFCSYPGISAVQYFAAALGRPWQGWHLVSAHGTEADPVAELLNWPQCFFLTDPLHSPSVLCRALCQAGLGEAECFVGENLGADTEAITQGRADTLADRTFSPLSVLLVCRRGTGLGRASLSAGIPDEAFERAAGIPLTKQEVRAVVLAKLAVAPDETVWDIGCGSGGLSVELALAARRGHVWAVDCRAEACALTQRNARRFGAANLQVVCGQAPAALAGLPAPGAVFIGGSHGQAGPILDAILTRSPGARLALTAVSVEGLTAGFAAFEGAGLDPQLTQISVSRTRARGAYHLLQAQSPVFLVTGGRP